MPATDEAAEFDDLEDFDDLPIEAAPSSAIPEASETAPPTQDAAAPETPALTAKSGTVRKTYELEMLGATVALVYVGMYFYGSSTNSSLASDFLAAIKPTLTANFAEVGACGDEGSAFRKESANEFLLYASGRRGCEGMLLTLELAPRQDLLSWVLSLFLPATFADAVVIDVPMTKMEPFVLGILPKRGAKAAHAKAADLKDLAQVVPKPAAKVSRASAADLEAWTFVTDAPEVLSTLLSAKFVEALRAHGPKPRTKKDVKKGETAPTGYFQMAHFTDQALIGAPASMQLSDKVLRFKFALPRAGDLNPATGQPCMNAAEAMGLLKPLIALAASTIDAVGRLRLSKKASSKCKSLRAAMNAAADKEAEAERAEAQRAAREEAERAEHERLVNMKDQKAAAALMAKSQRKASQQRLRKARKMVKA